MAVVSFYYDLSYAQYGRVICDVLYCAYGILGAWILSEDETQQHPEGEAETS